MKLIHQDHIHLKLIKMNVQVVGYWDTFDKDFAEVDEKAQFIEGCCCTRSGITTSATHGAEHIEEAMESCPVEAIKEIG